jgi:Fe-S cluster assembly iron-binding protein IscA
MLSLNAADTIYNQKNCEKIQLSIKVDLVSCSNRDYLIEYRSEDEVRGEVIKVTVVNNKDAKVIKSK